MNPVAPFLERQGVLILDGGLATELEARGEDLDDPLWSAKVLIERPARIRLTHLDYLVAGADCVVSASYQATIEGFGRRGLPRDKAIGLLRLSVALAREAREEFWSNERNRAGRLRPLVAASVGPYGAFLADGSEFRGDYGLDLEALVDFHGPRLEVLSSSGADLLACETVPSRVEALSLARLLSSTEGIPAWLSFSCRDGVHLCDGTPILEVVAEVDDCSRIVAVGVNCTAPLHLNELLRITRQATAKPLVAYPNSGEEYDVVGKRWRAGRHRVDLAQASAGWRDEGARLIGGCCRTGPGDIRAIRRRLLARRGGGR